MWRKIIAVGAVGVVGLVALACSNAAPTGPRTPAPAAPSPASADGRSSTDDSRAGRGDEVRDSSLAGGSLPADASDPALSLDPAVSGLARLEPDRPVSGPATARSEPAPTAALANDPPLSVNPPARDLPQTDLQDSVAPSQPNSVPPSPPTPSGAGDSDAPPPPELRKPIDRITGRPLDPDTTVSSPPLPGPGANVPAPVPSGPTQPGLTPLPSGTTLVPAPIDDAAIVMRESFPPQYGVEITAGLPGGCARQAGYEVARSGTTIRVSIYNAMPSSPMICTAIYGMYRVGVPLDNITPGIGYTVIVNDKTLMFTAQ